jgi:phage portal protein BeeE
VAMATSKTQASTSASAASNKSIFYSWVTNSAASEVAAVANNAVFMAVVYL